MSGPIIRKYGFPNFEKIFGERPLEHGVDEPEASKPAVKGDEKPPVSPESSGVKTRSSVPKPPATGQ